MAKKAMMLAAAPLTLAACAEADIGALGGCYEIDDAPAFRIDSGYGIHVDGSLISRMRLTDTSVGPRYEAQPGIMAAAGESGYELRNNPEESSTVGAIEASLFGTPYFVIPTGQAEPEFVEAYLNEEAEC